MNPPDVERGPRDKGPVSTLFDALQPTPGGAPAEALPRCWVCAAVTLRTGEDGRPVHAACEPADVYATAPETSHKAARSARKGPASPLARAILDELRSRPAGATDDELRAVFVDAPPGSASKRRGDLVRVGLVVDSGRTRPTRTGRAAIVWLAAA